MQGIMQNLPFQQPGQFYRGNLHMHSTRSDGRKTPEEGCAFYRELGYHFVSLTDHFMERFSFPITDTSAYWAENFITILGAELHAGATEIGEIWHILAVGLPSNFKAPTPDESGPAITQRALDAGAFVTAAHPAWYNLSERDVLSLGGIHAIEVINGISGDHNDRLDSWYMVDRMCALGQRYSALATDDAHFNERHRDTLRGWVWVKAPELTPLAIVNALKHGHYYSSTGPQIHHIEFSGREKVYIRCSSAEHIVVTGIGSQAQSLHGNGLFEAEFTLKNWHANYCRITVRDHHGERAWSNPIWFE
jgi:hypothetical protein